GDSRVHGTGGDPWRFAPRRARGSLFVGVRGLLGPHGTIALPGEHGGANAPSPRTDAAPAALGCVRTSESKSVGSEVRAVSREGSGEASGDGARARSAARLHPLPGAVDRGKGARMVGGARAGSHCAINRARAERGTGNRGTLTSGALRSGSSPCRFRRQ